MTATRLMVIGDAISRGTNRDGSGAFPATVYQSWRPILWTLLRETGRDVDFVGPTTWPDFEGVAWDQDNCCYGGATTCSIMQAKVAWIHEVTPELAPHAAVIMIGSEDCFTQLTTNPITNRIAEVRDLIADLRRWYAERYGAVGMVVVVCTIPPTSDGSNGVYRDQVQVRPFNTALKALVAEMGTAAEPVVLADCYTGFTTAMTYDGLKPNTAGEAYIGGVIFRALSPVLPAGAEPPGGPPAPTSAAYNGPHTIPGTVQAEDYDTGGEGSGYHDTTPGNAGGAYRQDDVDIETVGGVTHLAYVRTGEWVTYTISVTTNGMYAMSARVSSPNAGRVIAVTVDGAPATTIDVPNTGGWETYTTVSANDTFTMNAGEHVLRLDFSGDGQNLDWFLIELSTPTDPIPGGETAGPRAMFAAEPVEGTAPLTVRFTDTSIADVKTVYLKVMVLPGIPQTFIDEMLMFVPYDIFDLDPWIPVEGRDYEIRDMIVGGGIPVRIPWPLIDNAVVISPRELDDTNWSNVNGAGTGAGVRASVAVTSEEVTGEKWDDAGVRLVHELLHTITGLESADTMHTSEGFRAWLQSHPSEIGTAFLAEIATYPDTAEILALFYTYLAESYRVDPELTSGQMTYLYTFHDGTTSAERNPTHTFEDAGEYPIHLWIEGPYGSSRTTFVPILVHPPDTAPVAAFSPPSAAGQAPFGVKFYDRSTGGTAREWEWDFGDGGGSTTQHPTHVYPVSGVYSPKLTVYNGGGSSTVTHEFSITVNPGPAPLPPVYELQPAGYLSIMGMLEEAFAYIQPMSPAGPVGNRVATAGRSTWTADPSTGTVTATVQLRGTDFAALPVTLAGGAFYETPSSTDRLLLATTVDPAGLVTLSHEADTYDLDIHISVVADPVSPRIVGVATQNVRGETGTAMIITFRVENIGPGWKVEIASITQRVPVGGSAKLGVRVVKD